MFATCVVHAYDRALHGVDLRPVGLNAWSTGRTRRACRTLDAHAGGALRTLGTGRTSRALNARASRTLSSWSASRSGLSRRAGGARRASRTLRTGRTLGTSRSGRTRGFRPLRRRRVRLNGAVARGELQAVRLVVLAGAPEQATSVVTTRSSAALMMFMVIPPQPLSPNRPWSSNKALLLGSI